MSSPDKRFGKYAKKLGKSFKGRLVEREGMKRHTSFKIGGMAELMVWPKDLADLEAAILLARDMELPWQVLGAGSNILVKDGGIEQVVINMMEAFLEMELTSEKEEMDKTRDSHTITLGAGTKLSRVVKQCQLQGLAGLEFAAGIPGSVGGAVIMNAGSMGSCMADVVEWVEWYRPEKGVQRKTNKDLDYKYRRLGRPDDCVVVAAGLALRRDDSRAIQERIMKGLKKRRQTQPLSYPSAGSVFKNPPGDYAGRLIEAVGLKGERIGDAQVSDLHANFIVNRGRAHSRDVMSLIGRVKRQVKKDFKVGLELEIEVMGRELS